MLDKLNDRERLMVIVAGGGLFLFLIGYGLFFVVKQRASLRTEVAQERQNLQRMQEMSLLIRGLPSGQKVPDEDQLMAQMRQVVANQNMETSSSTHRKGDQVVTVSVNFNNVALPNLLQLLYDIEINGAVPARVSELHVSRVYEKERYDVRLTVEVQRPNDGRPN